MQLTNRSETAKNAKALEKYAYTGTKQQFVE
jgi:hypothetical protein